VRLLQQGEAADWFKHDKLMGTVDTSTPESVVEQEEVMSVSDETLVLAGVKGERRERVTQVVIDLLYADVGGDSFGISWR
jgi:hypothetical protein